MSEDKKNQEQIPAWATQLISENKELVKKVEMFEELAGKNTIASYEHAKKDFKRKTAKFKIHNDKIVIGWGDLDYSNFRPGSRTGIEENVIVTLFYLDGTKVAGVNFVALNRISKEIEFEILEMGEQLTKIKFPKDIINEYKLESDRADIPTNFINR